MKKGKGLANRIAAMLLSGMLVVGTASGIVLASETRADSGRTSENAEGYSTEETTGATEEFLTEEMTGVIEEAPTEETTGAIEEAPTEETTGVTEEAPTEETKETAEEPSAEDYSQAAAEQEAVSGEDTEGQEAGYAEENPDLTDVSQQPEETEGAVEEEAGSEETETSEQSDGAEVFEETGSAEQSDAAEVFEETETAEQADAAEGFEETGSAEQADAAEGFEETETSEQSDGPEAFEETETSEQAVGSGGFEETETSEEAQASGQNAAGTSENPEETQEFFQPVYSEGVEETASEERRNSDSEGLADLTSVMILPTDKEEPGMNCVFLGIQGTYISDAESVVDRINTIRREACNEGVINPVTSLPLTMADYQPVKWSGDLEYIARIRAAEAAVTMQHLRTNGESIFNLTSPKGVQSNAENLAWNWSDSVLDGIDQWYEEKEDWINQTDAVTGHYTALINPEYLYVGLGTFCSEDANYYNTTAAEFSIYNGLDETPMMMAGDCIQTLEVEARYLDGKVALRGGTEGVAGDMVPHALITETSFTKNGRTYLTNGLYCLNHVEWYSDNETVAEVNDGTVRAKRCGNATITAQQQVASIAASIDFQVEHIEEEVPAKPPTCTETGLTDGIVCSVCGEVIIPQETVPETGHKWNSGAVTKNPTLEEEGIITYTCSVCEAQKTQNIPKLIDLSDAEVGVVSAMTYTGKALKPEITVTLDGTELTEGADYTVTYSNNINVGTAAVKVTGKGSYAGAVNKTFKIKGISIANATVSGISNKAYTGSAITQNPTVKVGGKTLVKGTDYTLSYANNINAGTATVTITGKGTYASKKTVSFRINKAACSITAKAAATSVAVGKTTTVSITGARGSKSFKSSDTAVATVTSAGTVTARKVGTVQITATSAATSNYNAASKTVTIKVVPAATTTLTLANMTTGIKLTWSKVTGATGYRIYREDTSGKTLIKKISGGSTLTYTDTAANTNGRKYRFYVYATAGTGMSTLSKSRATYRLTKPAVSSVTNSAASKMTVKWGKNSTATGYTIQYSLSSSFASGNKTVTTTGASTVSKVIGSLTKGKTYYVRVRTYKTVDGAKFWSTWSASKSVKIIK